jgi:glycine betaine/proline transport system ATP-binding protein
MNPLGVLTARDVMGPGSPEGDPVTPETPVSDVMDMLKADPAPVPVTEHGRVIGSVTAQSVIERLRD